MQTFLPDADFVSSAAALDTRRLGKQRVEAFQILRALVWPAYGWKNHPAVAMWRGFTPALVAYGVAVCAEWQRRGHRDTVAGALVEFTGGIVPDPAALRDRGELPPWLGDEALHESHRAALARKDPGHYAPRWPGVDPSLPYVWPEPAFPRWPIHRPVARPLPLATALDLVGLADPPADLPRADLPSASAEPVETRERTTALLAALLHPAPAVWRLDSPAPTVTRADPTFAPLPASSVTARLAGAAETLATKAEAHAVPWVRFLHRDQPLPPRVGLVIVERGSRFLLARPAVTVASGPNGPFG